MRPGYARRPSGAKALRPNFHYSAAQAVTDGTNLISLPELIGGASSLVVSAGVIAAPAPDALFNGAPSIAFTGTQHVTSDAAVSLTTFMHDGSGCEIAHVLVNTAAAGSTRTVSSTNMGSAGQGHLMSHHTTNDTYVAVTDNGGTLIAQTLIATGVGKPGYPGVPYLFNWHGQKFYGNMQENVQHVNVLSQTVLAGADPPYLGTAGPFRLGARNTTAAGGPGNNFGQFRWCETFIFSRILTAYEREQLRDYVQQTYGIDAHAFAFNNAERQVLALDPYSWLRPDYVTIAAGKVTELKELSGSGGLWPQATTTRQIATPAPDAEFNNQPVGIFTGAAAQSYQYSLPTFSWSNVISGLSGGEHWHVLAPTAAAAFTLHQVGGSATTDPRYLHKLDLTTGGSLPVIGGNSGAVVAPAGGSAVVLNAPTYVGAYYQKNRPGNEWASYHKRTLLASGNGLTAPGGNAGYPMMLGASTTAGATPAAMRWAESIFFRKVLTDVDRQIWWDYLAQRYAMSA